MQMIIRSVNSLFILHESKLKERLAVLYSHGLDKHTVFKVSGVKCTEFVLTQAFALSD